MIRTLWLWSWKAPFWIPSRQVFALQLSQRAKLFLDHIRGNTWWAESQTLALLDMFCVVFVRTRPSLGLCKLLCSLNWKPSTITSFHSGLGYIQDNSHPGLETWERPLAYFYQRSKVQNKSNEWEITKIHTASYFTEYIFAAKTREQINNRRNWDVS